MVSVDANPSSIQADGKSCAQILVTVLDQTGTPVPDNTEVRLTTSAGDITPIIHTSGGRAVGILTSSTCPQIAVINAIASGVSGSVQVEFVSSDSEAVTTSSGVIRMDGGSLAYCMDKDTIQGSGGVSIDYRSITIKAYGAQVSQMSGQIRAQGKVSVQKGETTLTADAIVCDMRSGRIRLLNSNDQIQVKTFDIRSLEPVDSADGSNQDFAPLVNSEGDVWIISERLTLIPSEKILFYKSSIYVGDAKVIAMPYYSYSYEKRESILQQVRYTSSDGIRVDLPFYYQMNESGTGALKIRYAAEGNEYGGYSRPRKGLSLGLEQDYSMNDNGRGRVFIDAIGTSTQAFELAHNLDFGSFAAGGRMGLSARYQPSSNYAKGLYNATLNVAGNLHNYNYSFLGYFGGSRIKQYNPLNPDSIDYIDQSNCTLKAAFRPRSPIISKQLGRISPSLALGYGTLVTSADGITSSCLYQTLGLNCSRSFPDMGKLGISFDGTTSFTMTANGDTGASLRMGPMLKTYWLGGSMSIRYTLNLQGGTIDSASAIARHQLWGYLYFNSGSKWNNSTSINYGLDTGRLNLFSSFDYLVTNSWQLRSNYSLYRYAYSLDNRSYNYGTSYLKVGIYRPLGLYEIGVAWSPDGQDYGINKSQHIWLELNSGRF